MKCSNELSFFLHESCSFECLLHYVQIWENLDKCSFLKASNTKAWHAQSIARFAQMSGFQYSNELSFFTIVVHLYVYYKISKFGSFWISKAFSDCQNLNYVRRKRLWQLVNLNHAWSDFPLLKWSCVLHECSAICVRPGMFNPIFSL